MLKMVIFSLSDEAYSHMISFEKNDSIFYSRFFKVKILSSLYD